LGPIALYSSLPEEYRKNVRFLDSTIMQQSEIERNVEQRKAEIVAISCTTYNYPNALKVAEIAKEHHAHVICGGIHITHCRDAILGKMQKGERPIDFLVTGYGEPALTPIITALINKSTFENIPNLSYILNGKIIINTLENKKSGCDILSIPMNYELIDFKAYSSYFKPQGRLSNVTMVGSTYTQRGCAYAGKQKCSFCSIEQINLMRSPELFGQDLITLISKGVDHVRITDADFTKDIKHMEKITNMASKVFEETGKRSIFHCFARADEITPQKIDILKRLNAVSLMIGYESGSDTMLSTMNKHLTRQDNLQGTRLLKDSGIEVINGGLVLGAEGETEATLAETMDFLKELKQINNTTTMVATPLIPLPGSTCFKKLLQKYPYLKSKDVFNIRELVELWNHYFCDVSLNRLIEICAEIEKIYTIGICLVDFKK
jgi:magnesium-protoporphyrin IX monomethyl ester (oxidative) cyclase